MSLGRLWGFLAVALPVLGALLASLSSVDLAYHLRAGAEIIDGRGIPTADTWTFTAAGVPWIDQQWGAQLLLALTYRVGGWTGLVILRAALVGLVFWALSVLGRRLGLTPRKAAWLSLGAFFVSAAALGLRPQLLGMTLFAVVLLLVIDRHAHPRRLWFVPVLVVIWSNVHGSFFLGPVVLGLAWLQDLHDRLEPRHRTLQIAIVAAAAASITPFGPAVWAYAVGLSTNPAVTQRIGEWQPTSLRDVPGLLFFASAIAIIALLARSGRSTPWPRLLWLTVFFLVGVYAARGVAWWSLGVVVPVAAMLVDRADAATRQRAPVELGGARRLNALIAIATVAAGILLLPVWRPLDRVADVPRGVVADAPSGITATLRDLARPGDRLFNPQVWGSWFEFALPDLPVAIDSRIEFFPVGVWDAYERVVTGADGWERQLSTWGATIVVIARADVGSSERLSAAGWRTVYSDADGSIALAPGR